MNEYDVKRLALVLAVQTEVEGMKSTNILRTLQGDYPTYNIQDFEKKAQELRELAYAHNEQL